MFHLARSQPCASHKGLYNMSSPNNLSNPLNAILKGCLGDCFWGVGVGVGKRIYYIHTRRKSRRNTLGNGVKTPRVRKGLVMHKHTHSAQTIYICIRDFGGVFVIRPRNLRLIDQTSINARASSHPHSTTTTVAYNGRRNFDAHIRE